MATPVQCLMFAGIVRVANPTHPETGIVLQMYIRSTYISLFDPWMEDGSPGVPSQWTGQMVYC